MLRQPPSPTRTTTTIHRMNVERSVTARNHARIHTGSYSDWMIETSQSITIQDSSSRHDQDHSTGFFCQDLERCDDATCAHTGSSSSFTRHSPLSDAISSSFLRVRAAVTTMASMARMRLFRQKYQYLLVVAIQIQAIARGRPIDRWEPSKRSQKPRGRISGVGELCHLPRAFSVLLRKCIYHNISPSTLSRRT